MQSVVSSSENPVQHFASSKQKNWFGYGFESTPGVFTSGFFINPIIDFNEDCDVKKKGAIKHCGSGFLIKFHVIIDTLFSYFHFHFAADRIVFHLSFSDLFQNRLCGNKKAPVLPGPCNPPIAC